MTAADALVALAELQADVGLLPTRDPSSDIAAQLRARIAQRIDALRAYLVETANKESERA